MAAVAPLHRQHREGTRTSPRRAPLRLVPAPRRRVARHRDAAYAVTLSMLLAVGILGVLLLNTAMQTQADHIATAKQRLADLQLRTQVLQTTADQQDSPAVLAARARALKLRPATHVAIISVRPGVTKPPTRPVSGRPQARPARHVSARARAAGRAHAG